MTPKPYKYNAWNNCPVCGTKLSTRHDELEGDVPYCSSCRADRFPLFNVACSMIIFDKEKEHTLLVKQYGGTHYRFVAGYVNKGEDAENTVRREIKEELDANVAEMKFNHSHYFGGTNTLMLNYTVVLAEDDLSTNPEIDSYKWFTIEDAKKNVWKGTLVEDFLLGYLTGEYHFSDEND